MWGNFDLKVMRCIETLVSWYLPLYYYSGGRLGLFNS